MSDNIVEIILKLTDKATKEMEGAAKKWNSVAAKMSSAGKAMTLGVTAPLVAAGGLAIKAAADYEQALGAIDSVFEDAGNTIVEYSNKSADAVGLSANSFLELSTVTGAFLQNLGYTAAEAATETINLTERAADMAAVFNTDVDQALAAIQSGLKGEFNPLEQFGVKMNAASIEAKALSMGLADANGDLDDNAKAAAAVALIYEQTGKTAGQFASESGSLSGQMQIMKAHLGDISRDLGQVLLPIAVQFLSHLSALVKRFSELSPGMQKFIVYAALIAAAVGPVLLIVSKVITIFTTLAPVVSALSTVIGGSLVPALGATSAALAPIVVAALPVIAILAVVGAAIYALYWVWTNNINGIQENTKSIFANIVNIIGYSIDIIKAKFDSIKNIATEFIKGLVQGLRDGIQWVKDAAAAVAQAAVDTIRGVLGMHSPSKIMMGIGMNMTKGMAQGITQNAAIPVNAMAGVATATAMTTTNHNQINVHGNANSRMDMTQLAYQVAEVLGGL